jgi:GTP-binding protein HflX
MKNRREEHLKEGKILDLFENKNTFLISAYRSKKEKGEVEEHLEELESLCNTYGIEVLGKTSPHLRKINVATYLGKGKIEEIKDILEKLNISIVILDNEISPQQQKNLEKIFDTLVMDRTELILGVFAKRAKTKEAKIQVDLARYKYQLPRLKRLWTHLSRQRIGGARGGYLKGAGERQIEIDRKLLRKKISKLERDLEDIKRKRDVKRLRRQKSKIPTFAIIGYTNAGKSTLLKALTGADVFIEDKLFATLDTTTRKFVLPNNQEILFIDTVGFIRKIPHGLIASFKSTLEEALFSDILIHLIDVSSKSAEKKTEASIEVLKELKAENRPIITVLNKIDKCVDMEMISRFRKKFPKILKISALKGIGLDDLVDGIVEEIKNLRKVVKLKIPQSNYKLVSFLMEEGRVISKEYVENDIVLEVEIPKKLEKEVLKWLF